jgi:hypothetical protein
MSNLVCVADCRVGMKVRLTKSRASLGEGEIIEINQDGVLVDFPSKGARGLYDDVWFRYNSLLLEQLP